MERNVTVGYMIGISIVLECVVLHHIDISSTNWPHELNQQMVVLCMLWQMTMTIAIGDVL